MVNVKMSTKRFMIENVIIDRFRGFNGLRQFKLFQDNPQKNGIILLSGPNGFGKSSFIDAIEWCLTGRIRRLEEQFDKRKEKTTEKQKGLLRNTISSGIVSVEIQGAFGEQKIKIRREYDGNKDYDDGFLGKHTRLIVSSDDNIIIDSRKDANAVLDSLPFINFNISKFFYDRFVCSQEKTMHVYEKGRGDFYEMFSLFLGGTDEIETIENSIDGYINDRNKKKEKIVGLLEQAKQEDEVLSTEIGEKKDEIEKYKKQLDVLNENLKNALDIDGIISSYPELIIYKGEKLLSELYADIETNKLESEILLVQKNVLTDIAKVKQEQQLCDRIINFTNNLDSKYKYNDFKLSVYIPYKEKSEQVKLCQNVDADLLYKQKATWENSKIDVNQNIDSYAEILKLLYERYEMLYKSNIDYYNSKKLDCEQLESKMHEYKNLQEHLSTYSKTDSVINALEALIDNLDGFNKYRERSEECPLCGCKENFVRKDTELGRNAQQALLKYDEERAILKDNLKKLQEKIEMRISQMSTEINGIIDKRIKKIETLIDASNATNNIRYSCTRFGLDFKIINENLLDDKLNELQSQIVEIEGYKSRENEILQSLLNSNGTLSNIVSKLNNNYCATIDEFMTWNERDKIDALKSCVPIFMNKKKEYELLIDINDISEKLLQNKINILTKIKDILDGQEEIKKIRELIQSCNKEIIQKNKNLSEKIAIEEKIEDMRTSVKKIRNSIDSNILNNLNVPLNYIFRRINRHSIYDNIELKKPTRGVAKGAEFNINSIFGQSTFIPNIVSTGQLSAITLSIFLTVAMGQRQLPFRCYFMDDPIQSMDDINILSFIDLIRTELGTNVEEEKRFADQLFISTCNEDLEALIKHKAKHFGIGLTNFKFNGYGSFIEN